MPQNATHKAMPPNPSKKAKTSNKPKPEFCMPTSIAIVLAFFSEKRKALETIYPKTYPNPLWSTTAKNNLSVIKS